MPVHKTTWIILLFLISSEPFIKNRFSESSTSSEERSGDIHNALDGLDFDEETDTGIIGSKALSSAKSSSASEDDILCSWNDVSEDSEYPKYFNLGSCSQSGKKPYVQRNIHGGSCGRQMWKKSVNDEDMTCGNGKSKETEPRVKIGPIKICQVDDIHGFRCCWCTVKDEGDNEYHLSCTLWKDECEDQSE